MLKISEAPHKHVDCGPETLDILRLQNHVLELIARRSPLIDVLSHICIQTELRVGNCLSSVMVLNPNNNRLKLIACPSFPEQARNDFDGVSPGEGNGSCGTAVFTQKPTFVEDVANDKRWDNAREVAKIHSVGACWSFPIIINGSIAGSFGLTSFEKRSPSLFQQNLLQVAAYLAGLAIDLSKAEKDLKQTQAKLFHNAHYDSLTQLPNRFSFENKLENYLNQLTTSSNKKTIAVLFIDLDDFKTINDAEGHAAGDRVLKLVAKRLRSLLPEDAMLSRFGGDEFAIVTSTENIKSTSTLVNKIANSFTYPLEQDDRNYYVSASIGITMAPNDGSNYEELIRKADTAMYHAKQIGRNCFYFYDESLTKKQQYKLLLETGLRKAIHTQELFIVYQPQFDSNFEMTGVEALLRWKSSFSGFINPEEFIAIAETAGLILPIGEKVLTEVCYQIKAWKEQGINIPRVSINLSAQQLKPDFVDFLKDLMAETDVTPNQLELEVTESTFIRHIENNETIINDISKLGISLAMDDFGTGYSSISLLKDLPIQTIKIDKSLVKDIVTEKNHRAIVQAILTMADSLNLEAIAEGVETQDQLDKLNQFGCNRFQGFLMGKPMSPESIANRLTGNSRATAQ